MKRSAWVLCLVACSGEKVALISNRDQSALDGPRCPITNARLTWWDCPVWMCGNAATIFKSEVRALDLRGAEPDDLEEPFMLVRGSLQGAGGGCAGLTNVSLGMQDGVLVGVTTSRIEQVHCGGEDLEGSRFDLEQRQRNGGRRTVAMRIRSVDAITTAPPREETLTTYELVYDDYGRDVPVCGRKAAWNAGLERFRPQPWTWNRASHDALIVQGETYRKDATRGSTGPHWINLACAGSGLAKSRLLGMDPMNPTSTVDKRQATLKMLTAKYCGERSVTLDGIPIGLIAAGAVPESGGSDADDGPIESEWSSTGARCLSHLRLWSFPSPCALQDEVAVVEELRRTCNIPACEPRTCNEAMSEASGVWRTCTARHVRHR